MFVSWGVVFVLGIVHGFIRGGSGTPVIFVAVMILHAFALLCLLFALYNGLAFVITRSAEAISTMRREKLRGG